MGCRELKGSRSKDAGTPSGPRAVSKKPELIERIKAPQVARTPGAMCWPYRLAAGGVNGTGQLALSVRLLRRLPAST
jgi:hypothetical protein